MRHRLVNMTGFGNPDPVLLNNEGKINKKFAKEALNTYFERYEGFDFQIEKDSVSIGVEPAYQGERLKIIKITKDKNKSFIQDGIAFGYYGSKIVKSTKFYGDYKNKSKFVKFVDKWHSVLFENKNAKRR